MNGSCKPLLNLTSQDVAEVICRRLLAKNPAQPEALTTLIRRLQASGDGKSSRSTRLRSRLSDGLVLRRPMSKESS